MNKVTGQCLCKGVSLKFSLVRDSFGACHCGTCRKWSGSSTLAVEGKDVKFTGEEFITVYSSSQWAERGFCKRCGTHLFYRLKAGGFINFPLGLLEDAAHFKFATQIFIDKKPENYSFANETDLMTEAEVFAKYAPPGDSN
jgi:hypothetical protein